MSRVRRVRQMGDTSCQLGAQAGTRANQRLASTSAMKYGNIFATPVVGHLGCGLAEWWPIPMLKPISPRAIWSLHLTSATWGSMLEDLAWDTRSGLLSEARERERVVNRQKIFFKLARPRICLEVPSRIRAYLFLCLPEFSS